MTIAAGRSVIVARRPYFTLIAVTSRDGYIVPPDGSSPRAWASPEEQRRFRGIVAGLDWAFMGRRTHELAWWPDRRRVVFTRALAGPEWRHPLHLWADPARVTLESMLARLTVVHSAGRCGVLGGVEVHDWFAAQGLIDAVDLTIEPVIFAGGLPLLSRAPGAEPRALLSALGFREVDEGTLNASGTRFYRFERALPSGVQPWIE